MLLFCSCEEYRIAPAAPGAVVAVGNFDGVHRAHQALLAAVKTEAVAAGLAAVAVSFDPHPSRVLRPDTAPRLITPGMEKIRRLEATGLDAVLLLPFSRELSQLTPRQFVEQVLVGTLRARSVHEGENFRFGHRHVGTLATLRDLGHEIGFAVHAQSQMTIGGEVVSSSRVRAWIEAGNMARARHLLGRGFSVRAGLARGRGIGRQHTVPTLNLEPYPELLPARGVYLSRVALRGAWFDALTNVGVRPTFGDSDSVSVES
ncbi:MAG: riboflavin kinase, partial [Terriglobales bacterium]